LHGAHTSARGEICSGLIAGPARRRGRARNAVRTASAGSLAWLWQCPVPNASNRVLQISAGLLLLLPRRFSDFDGVAVSLKDRDGSFWPIASFRCYATIRRLSGGHSGLWQAVRPAHLWVHGLGVDPNVAMVFTRLRYELSELSKLSKLASIQSLVRSALRNRRERRPWVLFL